MKITRRTFLGAAAAAMGPWSLAGRKGYAATASTPALQFITPSEYRFIAEMVKEIIPAEPVLSGQVDPAKNIDNFFATQNYNPDFLVMLQYLRLIRLAGPMVPVIKKLVPATYKDIMDFKRTIAFLGYYSDANGEADLAPEKRIVWPRLGYGGPKPEDWFPPDREDQLDRALLKDRIKEAGL